MGKLFYIKITEQLLLVPAKSRSKKFGNEKNWFPKYFGFKIVDLG